MIIILYMSSLSSLKDHAGETLNVICFNKKNTLSPVLDMRINSNDTIEVCICKDSKLIQ